MLYKVTNRLFRGIYQYKIVLVVPAANAFRSGDMQQTLKDLRSINLINLLNSKSTTPSWQLGWKANVKTQDDLDFCFKLQKIVSSLKDFDIRVESPCVSIYTNNKQDIDKISKTDPDRVKYISKPPDNASLESGVVILPKIDFEYKITLGKTIQEHTAFIEWAQANKKVKLTNSCVRDLSRDRSWGGTYFYITGDKNVLMAKMHLGSSINKIERIVKA
jgi:hypothetical protein